MEELEAVLHAATEASRANTIDVWRMEPSIVMDVCIA